MTASRKSRARPGLLLAAALFAGFLLLLGMRYREASAERRSFEQAPPAKPVETRASGALALTQPEPARWQPSVGFSGTLLPIRESSLSFKVTGRLASVRVKVGDSVKAGQSLGELDAAEARAQHAAAVAAVHAAEVQLAIAEENEQRTRKLLEQNAVAASQHTSDRQQIDLARAQVETARAQAATALAALENTRLVAPFAGRVTEAPSAAGAIVTPGAALFHVEDTSALRLTATLSPLDAPLVAPGTSVALEGSTRTGRVTAVLPSVDAQTRRLPIVAEIDNRGDAPLLANVFTRATLVSGAAVDVLKLPASALRPGSQDEVVLADEARLRVARIVFVRDKDGNLLVRAGITASDRVLASPAPQLKDSDPLPAASSGAAR
jgi:RND family efflux transporter MFP subunit